VTEKATVASSTQLVVKGGDSNQAQIKEAVRDCSDVKVKA